MNEAQTKHFEDIIAKAVQSGKQETSGLVDMILHKMEEPIEKAINKHVNGKIKNLDIKIDAYIVEDLKWKEKAIPVLDAGTKAMNFGTVGIVVLKAVSTIGVAIGMVYAFFKWIKGNK
ncbi:hypothetical protein K9M47_03285 [Candidatus Gracilibacteria bacterium]|nr:hypothetical protein [Candidatus Gracilibacteria bacterium]